MRLKYVLSAMALCCVAVTSCIRKEALNVEAAIDGCIGGNIQQTTIDSNDHTVQLYVSKATDLTKVEINFTLAEGATIAPVEPLSGDNAPYYDFSTEKRRNFKVTSEDGAFTTVYSIQIWQTEMPTSYHFETLSSTSPYHIFYDQDNDQSQYIIRRVEWASGNPGFQLTGMSSTPDGYPTVQASGGIGGNKCLKLETKSTGSFGTMVKMPIAAGNLFIGSFDLANALKDAMAATHFGYPFFETPVKLEGYYRFKAGDTFTYLDENKTQQVDASRKDECDIYGVLYETDDEVSYLDGSNSLTSDHIVSLARDPEQLAETDTWTKFSFDFKEQNGKSIDADKLQAGKYKLAIVFSSSVDGAKFSGAVGSTLYVDEVTLITEEDSEAQ